MLKDLISRINNNALIKNIFILAGGSGIAQIFPLIASVFISRLYTPSEIGVYALYFSTCTILTTIICLGYENTIYLSKGDTLANNATMLCLIISLILSFAITIVLLLVPDTVYSFVRLNVITKYRPLIFLSLISSIVSTVLTIRFNRQGLFKLLSKLKILTAFTSGLIQVVMGYLHYGTLGLIIANIIAYMIADILFLAIWVTSDFFSFSEIKKRDFIYIFKRFRNFSIYMTPSGLISSVSNELPNFLLMKLFGDTIVGFYSFGQKIIIFPLVIIVKAVQNVFQKESTDEFHSTGKCRSIYMRTLKLMLPFALIAILGFVLLSPWVFKLAFGTKWLMSARFVQIIAIFIIIRSISSILSFPILLVEKQKMNLIFLFFLIVSTAGSYYLGYLLFHNVYGVLGMASFIGILFYLVYMKYSYDCSNQTLPLKLIPVDEQD